MEKTEKNTTLLEIMQLIVNMLNKKSPMAISTHVYIKFSDGLIELFSTNMDNILHIELEMAHQIKPTAVLVKADKLYDILKVLKQNIQLQVNEKYLTISDGINKFQLLLSTEKFPMEIFQPLNNIQEEDTIGIDSKILTELIQATSINIELSEGSSQLIVGDGAWSMLINDRRRFALTTYEDKVLFGRSVEKVNLSIKTISDLLKLTKKHQRLQIGINANSFILMQHTPGMSMKFMYKSLPSQLIPYNKMLEEIKFNSNWTVQTQDFKTAVEKMIVISSLITKTVKLDFAESINISSFDPNVGNSSTSVEIENSVSSALQTFHINGTYLLEALKCCSNQKLTIYINNNQKPMIITTEKPLITTYHLIMPIRI